MLEDGGEHIGHDHGPLSFWLPLENIGLGDGDVTHFITLVIAFGDFDRLGVKIHGMAALCPEHTGSDGDHSAAAA